MVNEQPQQLEHCKTITVQNVVKVQEPTLVSEAEKPLKSIICTHSLTLPTLQKENLNSLSGYCHEIEYQFFVCRCIEQMW